MGCRNLPAAAILISGAVLKLAPIDRKQLGSFLLAHKDNVHPRAWRFTAWAADTPHAQFVK